MRPRRRFAITCALTAFLGFSGCARENISQIDYRMGEKVVDGPLIYTVIETSWVMQLGDMFHARLPEQRFMLVSISVTNSGGREVSVPLLTLKNSSGKEFEEVGDGQGIDRWFGLLRTIQPAQRCKGGFCLTCRFRPINCALPTGANPGRKNSRGWISH